VLIEERAVNDPTETAGEAPEFIVSDILDLAEYTDLGVVVTLVDAQSACRGSPAKWTDVSVATTAIATTAIATTAIATTAIAAATIAPATTTIAALMIAAVAAVIAGIVTLVALLRTGVDAIVILIAGAGVAFHGTIIVLIASGGILAVIVWYGGCHRSRVVGDLVRERVRSDKNTQQDHRGRYQQRELFHRRLRFRHASTVTDTGFSRP
jgi:hypothetical protein